MSDQAMFASKNMTAGELNSLVKFCGGEEGARAVLRGECRLERICPEGVQLLNLPETFVTGPSLWIDPNFTSRISNPLKSVAVRPASTLKSLILPRNMSDTENCKKLLGGLETARKDATCPSQIWELIQAQPGGSAGKLLTNGYANIFYVVGKNGVLFTVGVIWDSGDSRWRVFCSRFGGRGFWFQGFQVFSN